MRGDHRRPGKAVAMATSSDGRCRPTCRDTRVPRVRCNAREARGRNPSPGRRAAGPAPERVPALVVGPEFAESSRAEVESVVRHALPAGRRGSRSRAGRGVPRNPCRCHHVLVLFDEVGLVREREAGGDCAIEFGFIQRRSNCLATAIFAAGSPYISRKVRSPWAICSRPSNCPGAKRCVCASIPAMGSMLTPGLEGRGFPFPCAPAPA